MKNVYLHHQHHHQQRPSALPPQPPAPPAPPSATAAASKRPTPTGSQPLVHHHHQGPRRGGAPNTNTTMSPPPSAASQLQQLQLEPVPQPSQQQPQPLTQLTSSLPTMSPHSMYAGPPTDLYHGSPAAPSVGSPTGMQRQPVYDPSTFMESIPHSFSGPPPPSASPTSFISIGSSSNQLQLPHGGGGAPLLPALPGSGCTGPAMPPPHLGAGDTLFIHSLPPHIQNGKQLHLYVPLRGLRELRVKRSGHRDVGFAQYFSPEEASEALAWFCNTRSRYGQYVKPTPYASDLNPPEYVDCVRAMLKQTPSAQDKAFAEIFHSTTPLVAEWARGAQTYRPTPTITAPLLLQPPPPQPPTLSAQSMPGPPPHLNPLSSSSAHVLCVNPQLGSLAASGDWSASPMGSTVSNNRLDPNVASCSTEPTRLQSLNYETHMNAPTRSRNTLFLRLVQNFTEPLPTSPVGGGISPETRTSFSLVQAILQESFFASYHGYASFRSFLRPPYFGGCFVRFMQPEDARVCYNDLLARSDISGLITVEYARQDSNQ